MNPELAKNLIDFLRREKPALRELPIPAYVERFLTQIEEAGFSIRKKSKGFVPNVDAKAKYLERVEAWRVAFIAEPWQKAFPMHSVHAELEKACLWLRTQAEAGHYKSNFGKFFHNWITRSKPTANNGATIVAMSSNPREVLIADGIRMLAASRSEKLFPSEFEMRFSVAMSDLKVIPTQFLEETFRRARMLELKSTPGILNVLDAWKTYKAEMRKQSMEKSEQEKAERERAENERWERMSPEERDEETARLRQEMLANRQRAQA